MEKNNLNFGVAFSLLKEGYEIKRESWAGYWKKEGDEILMYCKDGSIINIKDTKDIFFTLENTLAKDWQVANNDNSLLMNGETVTTFSFGEALRNLKQGKKVSRKGWNGKGLCLVLQVPDEFSKMTLPYVYMQYPTTKASDNAPDNHKNARVPWLASQTDMLSEDWVILD